MKLQRGDVVFLRFPFSDGTGSKVRPAVVVQSDRDNQRLESTIVVSITGNTRAYAANRTDCSVEVG